MKDISKIYIKGLSKILFGSFVGSIGPTLDRAGQIPSDIGYLIYGAGIAFIVDTVYRSRDAYIKLKGKNN